jgi:hypothetical protein
MCKVDILITVFSPKQFSGRTAAQAFTILLPVLIFLFPGVESSDLFGPCVPGLILAEHLRAPTVDFSILLSAPIQAPVFMLLYAVVLIVHSYFSTPYEQRRSGLVAFRSLSLCSQVTDYFPFWTARGMAKARARPVSPVRIYVQPGVDQTFP